MSTPPPMSTPIAQLPNNGAPASPLEDASVLNVIDEMERASRGPAPQAPMQPPPAFRMPVAPPQQAGLIDKDKAQLAAMAAVIALVIFYPASMHVIYSKLPKFESIFTSYDLLIRALLLAVVLYLLLWKLDL